MKVNLTVNERPVELDIDGDTPLLWVLRDNLQLTGTKYGCGVAQCGACTVHVNGLPRRSCVTPVSAIPNARVVTIEGLSGPQADAVAAAWKELDVPQCGFCQSGQVMTAANLLTMNPKPSDADIDAGMSGNLCRCATYARIKKAIHKAADNLGKASVSYYDPAQTAEQVEG